MITNRIGVRMIFDVSILFIVNKENTKREYISRPGHSSDLMLSCTDFYKNKTGISYFITFSIFNKQNTTKDFISQPGQPSGGVLVLMNFGYFSPSRFSNFYCNAMRKAIKALNGPEIPFY